jgi:hypothetical protein
MIFFPLPCYAIFWAIEDTTVIQIQLQPEVEAQLAAEAQARGMALEQYIIEKLVGSRPVVCARQRSVGQAIDSIRELRKGNNLGGLRIKDLIHEGHKY